MKGFVKRTPVFSLMKNSAFSMEVPLFLILRLFFMFFKKRCQLRDISLNNEKNAFFQINDSSISLISSRFSNFSFGSSNFLNFFVLEENCENRKICENCENRENCEKSIIIEDCVFADFRQEMSGSSRSLFDVHEGTTTFFLKNCLFSSNLIGNSFFANFRFFSHFFVFRKFPIFSHFSKRLIYFIWRT